MYFREIFFPPVSRSLPGMRWINIILRTLHLIGIAGVGGAYLYPAPPQAWMPYLVLSVLSGFAMVGVSIYSNGVWLLQLRGLAILLKVLMLLLLLIIPEASFSVAIAVIVLSGVIAHAPGNLRYFSPWHRRRIDHP